MKLASTASAAEGITALLGGPSYNINIIGNIVEETTYSAACTSHRGISVTGISSSGSTRNVSVRDNTLIGVKSGALLTGATRIGIWIRDVNATTVQGNLVDWNAPGVLEGIGIAYATVLAGTWRGHLCANNYITSDGSAAAGGEIDINTTICRTA
ncbi:hypothetical protein HC928_03670 [bacterium]|nr:hypothetical protein [bacterium]